MTTKYTFFWKNRSPFSQWYPSKFTDSFGHLFVCAEQYMMWNKAILFGDTETAVKILATTDPREQKGLGRQVRNFNHLVWEAVCQKVVTAGNYFKFSQNPKLLDALMGTGSTQLVEASPYDRIWGIGYEEHDALANLDNWGKNYLGHCLVDVREWIKAHPGEAIPCENPLKNHI